MSADGDRWARALKLETSIPIEEWLEAGRHLQQAERSVMWWIGDWVRFGKAAFGERYIRPGRDLLDDAAQLSRRTRTRPPNSTSALVERRCLVSPSILQIVALEYGVPTKCVVPGVIQKPRRTRSTGETAPHLGHAVQGVPPPPFG